MTITKNESGKTMELFIEGWVDIVNAPELAKEIDNLDPGIENLILDFKKRSISLPSEFVRLLPHIKR